MPPSRRTTTPLTTRAPRRPGVALGRSLGRSLGLPLGLSLAVALSPALPAVAVDQAPAAPAAAPTRVTAKLSAKSAALGKKVVLSGKVSGGARKVSLQTRDSRGRWRTLSSSRSTSQGAYRFSAPTWHRTHPLRVKSIATSTHAEATSKVLKLKRTVSRTSGGKKSNWRAARSRSVRWNPCRSYPVRVNTANAPSWFAAEVKSSLRSIKLHTGIPFTWEGKTRAKEATAKSPLVVRWSNTNDQPRLAGSTVGLAETWSDGRTIIRATVFLDRGHDLSRAAWRSVLRHELAHAVGLDHINVRSQLMYPSTTDGGNIEWRSKTWGRGDIEGLKQLGAAHGCIG